MMTDSRDSTKTKSDPLAGLSWKDVQGWTPEERLQLARDIHDQAIDMGRAGKRMPFYAWMAQEIAKADGRTDLLPMYNSLHKNIRMYFTVTFHCTFASNFFLTC